MEMETIATIECESIISFQMDSQHFHFSGGHLSENVKEHNSRKDTYTRQSNHLVFNDGL